MAEISKITLPNGNTYDIKDTNARDRISALESFTTYLGVTTTQLTNGSTTNPIVINGEEITAQSGNIVLYGNKEFIFDGVHWNEFGDLSSLGTLAYKNSASGDVTPVGSVSQPTFTGTAMTSTGSFKPKGNITISSSDSGTANYTPSGTISQPSFTGSQMTSTGSFTPNGNVTISEGSGTVNYTPEGTCTGGNVTLNTTTVNSITSVGSLPECTLPTYTVQNEILTITAGSFSQGELPQKGANQTVATGVKAVTQPTFNGTGTQLVGSFSGTSGNISVTGTPSGTVSQPSFTGNGAVLSGSFSGLEESVSVSGTPSGTVSQPSFTGTTSTVTVT